MQPYPDGPASSDYERILEVIGACAAAGSLTALRETLLESLASRFGYRHAVHGRGGRVADRLASHSNGFIAAFTAGLAFTAASGPSTEPVPFLGTTGTLLSPLVRLVFGTVAVVRLRTA